MPTVFPSARQPPTTLLETASANDSTKVFSEQFNCCCTAVIFPRIDGRRCWPRLLTPSDHWTACLLVKRPTRGCFVFFEDTLAAWGLLGGYWHPELCCCVDMCETRATPFAIQWSLSKGIPIIRLCVHRMGDLFIVECWMLSRELGAVGPCISREVLSEPSCCCRFHVFLMLLFVSADGNCDFMLMKA